MTGFTTANLEAIEAAIASGELVVQQDGKRIQYRSMDELRAARQLMRAELQASGALTGTKRGAVTVARFERD